MKFQILIALLVSSILVAQAKLPALKGTIAVFGGSGCLGRECVYQVMGIYDN